MPNVNFTVEHQVIEVPAGRRVREVALEAGIYPNREWFRGFNCGGRGLCGTCKVWVKPPKAANAPNWREKFWGLGDGRRLACQTIVLEDMEVATFPGGDDRLTAGRSIDPAPVRAEAQAEATKAAAPAAKEASPAKVPKEEKGAAGSEGKPQPASKAKEAGATEASEGKS